MTMTKQEIADRLEELDVVVAEAGASAEVEATTRARKAQKTERMQLEAECAAAGGHYFTRSCGRESSCCQFCDYDKNTPANTTAANLSKG